MRKPKQKQVCKNQGLYWSNLVGQWSWVSKALFCITV